MTKLLSIKDKWIMV